MTRAATLVLVMLAMSASAAVDARALAREGQKTQWAPTRKFSTLNAHPVFEVRTSAGTSPYAGEDFKTAAAAKEAGFTGHKVESAPSVTYAQQRWLDTSTGTWMSRDPVGAGSYVMRPNELNPWQYAAGNPTRFTDPSGRAIPPTLYSPLSPADPTPVAACKAGNMSACLQAGMTDAEIEAFFAERGVVTRLATEEVVEEVTTEVVIHAPKTGFLGSIGKAFGIGGAVAVTGVAFSAAQVTSLRRGCAHGDIASCEILDRYGLGRAPDRSAIPGVESTEAGTVSVAPPSVVPNASVATATRYPNQTCTDAELDALESWKDGICKPTGGYPGLNCSDSKTNPKKLANLPCSVILARIAALKACRDARQRVQDVCFGGAPDPGHHKAIDDLDLGMASCELLKLTNCAPGHPMANR